jgi:phage-related minor tail protein
MFGLTPKAVGGSVQRGQPYMVGERGAEMFVPNQSGSIIPTNKLAGGGAGVVVNQTINLSTGVAQTVRTEVMNMLPQIQNAAVSGVLDAKRRGGSFGTAFGA